MKSIYKNPESKHMIWSLYDQQLEALHIKYTDLYIDSLFGQTHMIECGNLNGPPLLLFHGGNITTAYNLKDCRFLLHDFHIYAVDTIGHPGKSAEISLSPYRLDYGKWAVSVINSLGYEKISCFGGSFGAGILVKAMCIAPKMIAKSVLLVPAGIKNAPIYKNIKMAVPMLLYWLTQNETWFIKSMLPMAIYPDYLTDDLLITARCSIDHARLKLIMPRNEPASRLTRYQNPILIMAAEKDCLFPAKKIFRQAKKAWKQSKRYFYFIKNRGHICQLTEAEEQMIINFLQQP